MNIPDFFSNGKYSKPLLTIGFLLIVHNFLTLYFHQPQGYVVDIYSVLPLSFYGASILCYLISSVVLLSEQGLVRKFGILLLVLNHLTILSIPYMLGYYSMGRADDMSYIGTYVHISKFGAIGEVYPASLILGATISFLSGLPANGAAFIMPVVFSLMFVGGLCLCCRFLLKEEKLVNIAILSSFIFYLGPYNFLNVPHAVFFAYMPLFIFVLSWYIEKPDFSTAALVLIPTTLVPFMHPFIVLFVFAFLLSLTLLGGVLNRFIQGNYWRATRPLIVLFMGFFSWFIYCDKLFKYFEISHRRSLKEAIKPILLETTDKLARINIDFVKMTKLLFVYYSRYLIPFIIIAVALILVYLKRIEISQFFKKRIHFLFVFYILFLIVEVFLFLNPIPMFNHQPDRMTNLNFMVYFQVPLFALSLSVIFAKSKLFNRQSLFLIILLTGTWSLGFFGTFDSPNIFRTNVALTYNEVEGMEWFYDVKDGENIIVPVSQIERFHALFDDGGYEKRIFVPNHFGYDPSPSSFANINLEYNQQSYVVLLTLDELLYQEVPGYVEVGRYTAGDYVRFRNDRSVDVKTYDNLNIEIYSTSRA